MKLCDLNHDVVAYQTSYCPVCEVQKEIERYQQEIETYRTFEQMITDYLSQRFPNSMHEKAN